MDKFALRINELIEEHRSIGKELGKETEIHSVKLLKGYVKLGYDIPNPETFKAYGREEFLQILNCEGNKLQSLESDNENECNKETEKSLAKLISVYFHREWTCRELFGVRIQEMKELRNEIMVNNNLEKIEQFEKDAFFCKEMDNEIKCLLDKLNELFKRADNLFRIA